MFHWLIVPTVIILLSVGTTSTTPSPTSTKPCATCPPTSCPRPEANEASREGHSDSENLLSNSAFIALMSLMFLVLSIALILSLAMNYRLMKQKDKEECQPFDGNSPRSLRKVMYQNKDGKRLNSDTSNASDLVGVISTQSSKDQQRSSGDANSPEQQKSCSGSGSEKPMGPMKKTP